MKRFYTNGIRQFKMDSQYDHAVEIELANGDEQVLVVLDGDDILDLSRVVEEVRALVSGKEE